MMQHKTPHTQHHCRAQAALFRTTRPTKPLDLVDPEFGHIRLKRNAKTGRMRLSVTSSGQIYITMPRFMTVRHARTLVDQSRSHIRSWRADRACQTKQYTNGETIGQSHMITVIRTAHEHTTVRLHDLAIEVSLAQSDTLENTAVQQRIQTYVAKALDKEARAYLPRRLRYLADTHGFSYTTVRFGKQKSRWGSCSGRGTISLNINLMALDKQLIDYVLIHELCHTRHMNHSPHFWASVERCLPTYKELRTHLRTKEPRISV